VESVSITPRETSNNAEKSPSHKNENTLDNCSLREGAE
jgi:hypothetical protein